GVGVAADDLVPGLAVVAGARAGAELVAVGNAQTGAFVEGKRHAGPEIEAPAQLHVAGIDGLGVVVEIIETVAERMDVAEVAKQDRRIGGLDHGYADIGLPHAVA